MSGGAIGIDIGGTAVKAVRVGADGVIERQLSASAHPERGQLVDEVLAVLHTLQDGRHDLRLGLAAAGIPHPDGRSTQYCPGGKLDIEGLDWQDALAWPDPVPILNDAHAALLGECWIGAARGRADAVMLTLGTGVGGAALVGRRLLTGARGRGGHFGHLSVTESETRGIVGTPGTLEDAIGEQTVTLRSEGRVQTTAALVGAVERGEPWAVEVWTRSVRTLSRAIASLVNVFDPEVVVLGGGIARAGDTLFVPLAAFLARDEWRPGGVGVPVVPATLGALAGAIGAARQALTTEAHR